jgi:hypothetical protein
MEFQFPVSCRVMHDCWITNHVDLRGTSPLSEDYMCGKKVSDQYQSTDISLGSYAEIDRNFAVIAMADGRIRSAGNAGGAYGNRIIIDHDSGWASRYSHLRPETIIVRAGQPVKQGQILGAVGMSGAAEWPRLSMTLTRNGMVFDPFSGRTTLEGCEAVSQALWVGGVNPPYEPAHVTRIGFSTGFPSDTAIIRGAKGIETAATDATRLSLWGMMMNTLTGDRVHLKIETPGGRVLKEETITIDNDEKYFPLYFTAIRRNMLWEPGLYRGTITLTRNVNGNDITTGKFTSIRLIRAE